MKRLPGLRDLSEDHHHGLVLARKAKRTGAGEPGPSAGEVWSEVEMQFSTELAPHFLIEETHLAPGLEAAGETALAKRLFEEHQALRSFLQPGSGRSLDDLARFGELLERHIRFEEQELFEVAQRRLSLEALAAVAQACRANTA